MKQKLSIVIIAILIGLVVWRIFASEEQSFGVTNIGTGLQVSEQPPQFTLQTVEQQTVSLEQFEGKKVILNFWATWCLPCRQEMPALQAYSEQHGEDVVVLAVNMLHKDSTVEKVQQFGLDYELTFPILLDEDGSVSKAYKVVNIPSTYFIDEQGTVLARVDGALDESKLDEYLDN